MQAQTAYTSQQQKTPFRSCIIQCLYIVGMLQNLRNLLSFHFPPCLITGHDFCFLVHHIFCPITRHFGDIQQNMPRIIDGEYSNLAGRQVRYFRKKRKFSQKQLSEKLETMAIYFSCSGIKMEPVCRRLHYIDQKPAISRNSQRILRRNPSGGNRLWP